jgi:transcriptional regulator with XRE-family HTH domain
MTPRAELAELLRQARLAAGYSSQAKLAKALHVSRPLISRAENAGEALPSADLLAGYADATGVDAGKIAELTERAKSGTPEFFMPYKQAEAVASILWCWSPTLVPGLLQCGPYARALFDIEGHSLNRIEELVTARMERQAVIGRAHLTAVIDQHVLNRLIGSPAVMAEQCGYLASMAEQRKIALHVMPENVNIGAGGALDIATGSTATTVCLTTGLDDVTSTASDVVVKAMQTFERILGAAMPCAESLTLVRAMEDQWKTRI